MHATGSEKLPATLEWYRQTGNWIAVAASALLGVQANFLKQIASSTPEIKSLNAGSAIFLLFCVLSAICFFVTLTRFANALETQERRRRQFDYETNPLEQQRVLQALKKTRRTKKRAQIYWWFFQAMLFSFGIGIFLLGGVVFLGITSPIPEAQASSPSIEIFIPFENFPESDARVSSPKNFTLPLNVALGWASVRPTLELGKDLKLEFGLGAHHGEKGDRGEKGEQGEKGERGPPGKDGKNCEVEKEPEKVVVPSDAFFEFDRYRILPEAANRLGEIAAHIRQANVANIKIDAYTDGLGTLSHNRRLSEARANAVRQWLITWGKIDPYKISANGKGVSPDRGSEINPDGSDNPSERARHRRVEISYSR